MRPGGESLRTGHGRDQRLLDDVFGQLVVAQVQLGETDHAGPQRPEKFVVHDQAVVHFRHKPSSSFRRSSLRAAL